MNKRKSFSVLAIIGMAIAATPILAFIGSKISDSFQVAPYNPNMHALPAYAFETEPDYSTQNDWTFNAMNINSQVTSNYTGNGVKLAIIDSGINYDHEDFIKAGINVVDSHSMSIEWENSQWKLYTKANGYESHLDDENGHGTNVAACVASQLNGVGGSGLAPDVDLYIFNAQGYQWGAIQTALNQCVSLGVDIVNMSIQAYTEDITYQGKTYPASYTIGSVYDITNHVNSCYNHGITVVAAAGNYNTEKPSYPAALDHVISVGSLAKSSSTSKASYSNTGYVDVITSGSVYVAGIDSNSHYKETQGTSFSSPLVSAALALYKQKNPSATPSQIEQALYSTCDPIAGNPSWAGNGRLNVAALLDLEEPPATLSSISVKTAPTKTTYIEGNYFDPTGLVITATYSDSSTIDIDYATHSSDFSFNPSTSTSLTTSHKSVSITYGGKSVTQNITVNAKSLMSISVSGQKTSFMVGDTFSFEGTVTASYDNETSSNVTALSSFTGYDMSITGNQTVTVTYNNQSTTYQITVSPRSETLTITRSSFSTAGGYAWYSWTQSTSDSNSISGKGELYTAETKYMQMNKGSGNKCAAIFNTVAIPGEITSISAKANKTTYRTFNAYVSSTAYSLNGNSMVVGSNATQVGSTTTINGSQTSFGTTNKKYSYFCVQETVSSAAYLDNIIITYIPKIVDSISVKTAPTKTVYEENEFFDPTGLVITANYTDGSSKDISYANNASDFSFNPSTSTGLKKSDTSVTITYKTKTTNQSITVKDAVTLSSISISGYTTNFVEGDEFVFGGTVTAHYSDSTSSNVTSSASFSGYDMTTVDSQTVTVSYTYKGVTKSTTYSIIVSMGTLDHISVSGQTTVFVKNGAFSFDGTCTAYFENTYQKSVTPTSISTPDMSTGGNKTVTVSYTYNGKTVTTNYSITVNAYRTVMEASEISKTYDYSSGSCVKTGDITDASDPTNSGYTNFVTGGIQCGSGKQGATITVSTTTTIIKKVTVYAKQYGASEKQLKIDTTTITLTSSFEAYDLSFNDNTKKSVSISCTKSGDARFYLSKIIIYGNGPEVDIGQSDDCVGLETFINNNLHMNDYTESKGWCKDEEHHYYSTARDAFNLLNDHQRALFTSNSAYSIEWARLSTWASYNGESLNSNNKLAVNSSSLLSTLDKNNDVTLIVVVSLASILTLLGVFVIYAKKKQHNL